MSRAFRSIAIKLIGFLAVGCAFEQSDWEDSSSLEQSLTVQSGACRVDYTVSSDWGTGFGADVKITNLGGALSKWTLEWNYHNGQRVTSSWNGTAMQTGGAVRVTDAGWNGSLATGASASFGFNGTSTGTNGNPSGFKLNGKSCEGGGSSGGGSSTGGSSSTGGTAPATGGTSATGGSGGGTCSYPSWQQGAWYEPGNIVRFEGALYIAEHANPGYSPTISTWFWDPYSGGCSTGGGSSTGGTSGGGGNTTATGFEQIVSRAQFDAYFPSRNSFYTYDGLVEAAKIYPTFVNEGSLEVRKREAAAFLANIAHETGKLVYIEEINKGDYTDYSPWFCTPAPGQRYFGRGPIQLSWNYNYCAASQSIFGNPDVLRLDPGRVARESKIAWATGIWFWMTQTGAGNHTAHNAMVQGLGFGETIRTINGSLECGGRNPATVQLRISYYQDLIQRLGGTPGSNLGC